MDKLKEEKVCPNCLGEKYTVEAFAELLNENFVYVHNGLYRHVATLQDYTITQIYQQFKQRN